MRRAHLVMLFYQFYGMGGHFSDNDQARGII